jgi:hypothetical protein
MIDVWPNCTPTGVGRLIDEAIAIAEAFEAQLGYSLVPDPGFAKDVQEGIDAHREPLGPPDWDWSSIRAF